MTTPVQRFARGVGVAVLAGLLAGVAMRLLMRAAALVAGDGTGFTVGGTVFIAGLHVVPLVPGAVSFALSRGRWPWIPFGLGIGVLLFFAVTIGVQDVAAAEVGGVGAVLLGMVVLLMVAVYAALVVAVPRLARPRRDRELVPA